MFLRSFVTFFSPGAVCVVVRSAVVVPSAATLTTVTV